jgi:hypothetical protein
MILNTPRSRLLSGSIAAATLAAAAALALGGAAATAGEPVPGPRQPVQHVAVSGGLFQVKSGKPGCFTGAGTVASPFPIPAGVLITGATVHLIDSQPGANISAALNRHDLASGGTFELGRATSSGTPGTAQLEITIAGGARLDPGQALNMGVTVGDGTCFKGAEVHYLADDGASPALARTQPTRAPGFSPQGDPVLR